jgi:uncharacterized membrane protein YqjE
MANNGNGRSVAAVVKDLKAEVNEFLQTRYDLFLAELKHKISALKIAAPLLVAALLFGLTAFLMFTLGLVALIAIAFAGSPFAYAVAFAVVMVLYILIGVACAWFVLREWSAQGVTPKKTLKVLKDDKIWLQTEARSQV